MSRDDLVPWDEYVPNFVRELKEKSPHLFVGDVLHGPPTLPEYVAELREQQAARPYRPGNVDLPDGVAVTWGDAPDMSGRGGTVKLLGMELGTFRDQGFKHLKWTGRNGVTGEIDAMAYGKDGPWVCVERILNSWTTTEEEESE